MPSQSSLLGAAGEYHVMSELLRRGYIAALAPQGVPNSDIVVTDVGGSRLCSIQVKCRRDIGADGGWHMKKKHESIKGARLFYCFVDFGKALTAQPKVHLIPANVVADVLTLSHQAWLVTPGKGGKPHNDHDMRRLLPDYGRPAPFRYQAGWLEQYRDAWHLLRLEQTDATESAAMHCKS